MPPDLSRAIAAAKSLVVENKPEAALAQLQRVLPKHPRHAGLASVIAGVNLQLGRLDQARYYAQRASELEPQNLAHLTNLSVILLASGREGEAVPLLRRVLEHHPDHQETLLSLANALLLQRQYAEALGLCRRGLAASWHTQLAISCAAAIQGLGDFKESAAFLEEALRKSPEEPRLAAALVQARMAMDEPPAAIAAAHRAAGQVLERTALRVRPTYTPAPNPTRTLRVGLFSPDLRHHSVAYFLEPLLEHHEKKAIELVCYSNNTKVDDVTRRFKALVPQWRETHALSDQGLIDLVARDRIDIAIDLAGHTHGHRLGAFAARLAPVQITYLGYPDTTGLTRMDYRIVDSLTDPPGAEDRCTEQLIRLDPCFLCYRPPSDGPALSIRDPQSPIRNPVFGSFNDARKNNPRLFAMWGKILAACPGSTLALKSISFSEPQIVERTLAGLAAAGVAAERVRILSPTHAVPDHLAHYNGIDIALDPTPYNGTTTTCEALWMGVPVVTLAGNRHSGRVGVSLLTNIGAPELIAKDDGDYVRIATQLAAHPERLQSYRATLRDRVLKSPLCDATSFCRRFESALREAWTIWCKSKAAGH
jgi:predicted O-linked N-acetylglucosamine transferase (SPINDLY family)